MGFYPFEVTAPHLVYTLLGGFTVVFGMFSAFIKEKLYLGEAPIATIFGIILGPHVSGLIDPYKWGGEHDEVRDEITLEVTRVVIAISVFAAGVELPKAYMLRHWRSMTVLLLPAMLWGWFISALFMWALIPRLKFLSCLLIAAAVTPTDPILAQSVIGGKFADKHVPAHVRHMLSAESGSNDGAAFPFMYIALYLTLDASPGHAVGEWFYATIAYEIILGTVLGALLGYSVRKVMQFAERRNYIDRQSFVAQYVSLALLSTGGTVLLGSDDLLSAFACGCAFAWDGYFNQQTEDAVFSNVVDLLFNCAAFIYIGALLPFPSFNDHSIGLDWWRLVLLAICILIARRLPAILAMYKLMPDVKTFREACFTGWFGPMGVGAVFISTLARHELPEGDPDADTEQVDYVREVISPIVLFIVLSSVLTHGLSIPFFSLGRRVHSLTYTWSRQPSMRDAPAWTTHTHQVRPGETILVNRDEEDGEGGDVGLHRARTGEAVTLNEKQSQMDSESRSASGSGSATADGDGLTRDADGNVVDEKQESGARRRNVYEYDEERGDRAEMEQDDHDAHGERAGRDDARRARSGGRRTPPVAEYREGDDLIIERDNRETGELDVQVIKHHFRADKKPLVHSFSHPESLEHNRGVLASIMPTLERWASAASMSTIGRGSRPPTPAQTPLPQHRDRTLDDDTAQARQQYAEGQRQSNEEGGNDGSDGVLHRSGSGAVPVPIPNIRVDSPELDESSQTQVSTSKPSLRTRLFGRRSSNTGSSNTNDMARAQSRDSQSGIQMQDRGSSSLQRPHINTSSSASSGVSGVSGTSAHNPSLYRTAASGSTLSPIAASPLDLTRTTSASGVSRTIRFAPELAPSSDTVPGPAGAPNTGTAQDEEGKPNYGNNVQGFKRTPGLGLFRTSSIKQEDE